MSQEANNALGRLFFQEQDRLKGGPAEDLCAPDYTARIAGGPALDRSGHAQFATAFYAGFPDLRHIVEDTLADDNKVAVRFTVQGTHTGDFMGIPATGKPISLSAIVVLDVKEGKVSELNAIFDQFGMMQQIGVIPS